MQYHSNISPPQSSTPSHAPPCVLSVGPFSPASLDPPAEYLFWHPDVAEIRTLPAPHRLDEGILYPMLSCYCHCSNAEAMSRIQAAVVLSCYSRCSNAEAYRLQLYPSDVSASRIAFTKRSLVRNRPLSRTKKRPGCCPRLTI